jgi:hypothetical protein
MGGMVPEQMVGPTARLAGCVHVRAAEEISLHVHLQDFELTLRLLGVGLTQFVERSTLPVLCTLIETPETRTIVIMNANVPEWSALRFARLRRAVRVVPGSRMIGRHKLFRAGASANSHLCPTRDANVDAHIPVSIDILNDMLELDFHRTTYHAASWSHGLPVSISGNALKAMSSWRMSHTRRELMTFGLGIRPSFTISSNKDGETPTYSVAGTLILINPRPAPLWQLLHSAVSFSKAASNLPPSLV